MNVIALAQALIKCPSVTPEDAGVLGVLEQALNEIGFCCQRVKFEQAGTLPVDNLYARYGAESPNLCFAGHTDVVPVGDIAAWSVDPFGAEIKDGYLYGRGAEDMKGAVAAFVAAAAQAIKNGKVKGSLSLLITNDEEGPAINGTRKMLELLAEKGEKIDACIVGEPTSPEILGEMAKIGRRGSFSAKLTVIGTQGHVAYPQLADNPITKLVGILARLKEKPLDSGTEFFQPSNLEITSVDVDNKAGNVIPAKATAIMNVRFNPLQSFDALEKFIRAACDAEKAEYGLEVEKGAEAFITAPGKLSEIVVAAASEITGITPALTTTGGTSDARFIKDYCPVVEFGTTGLTPHKINERVKLADLENLAKIYERIIELYME